MDTLWKTTRPDGRPWHAPSGMQPDDLPPYEAGRTYRPRVTGPPRLCSETVLHAARTPEEAAGRGRWPYILWRVQGAVVVEREGQVGCRELTVVERAPVHLCWGPCGRAVERVVRAAGELVPFHNSALLVLWDADWYRASDVIGPAAARKAARLDAFAAARSAADGAAKAALADCGLWNTRPWAARGAGDARDTAWAVAGAMAMADLIGQHGWEQHHIDLLTRSWRQVVDPDLYNEMETT